MPARDFERLKALKRANKPLSLGCCIPDCTAPIRNGHKYCAKHYRMALKTSAIITRERAKLRPSDESKRKRRKPRARKRKCLTCSNHFVPPTPDRQCCSNCHAKYLNQRGRSCS